MFKFGPGPGQNNSAERIKKLNNYSGPNLIKFCYTTKSLIVNFVYSKIAYKQFSNLAPGLVKAILPIIFFQQLDWLHGGGGLIGFRGGGS